MTLKGSVSPETGIEADKGRLGEHAVKGESRLRALTRRSDLGISAATILLYVLFSLCTEAFFTAYNQFNLLRTSGLYIFIALSQGMLQISGGTSLSIGAAGVFSGMVSCMVMQDLGMPIFLAVIAGCIAGMITGLVTGLIVVKVKLPAFVVTLAMQYVFNGLVMGITRGYPYESLPPTITMIGRHGIGVVSYVMVLAVAALIILWYMFRYTVIGRRMLATGGNIEAARLSGIATDRVYVFCSILSGLFSAIAALLWISRTGSMQANLGADWMLISFSVAMLGGSKAGAISMPGIFFAAILIALIKNGLTVANVNVYYENVFLGVIVLFSVSLDNIRTFIAKRARRV